MVVEVEETSLPTNTQAWLEEPRTRKDGDDGDKKAGRLEVDGRCAVCLLHYSRGAVLLVGWLVGWLLDIGSREGIVLPLVVGE